MSFEKQWRQDYPATKTIATEKFLKTNIQLKDDGIAFSQSEGIPFRGVIDRIDADDQGQIAVLDYKSSGASLTAHKSWLEKGKLQLALYSLALQEGVVTESSEEVVGAFYYIMKDMNRRKGFSVDTASEDFLPLKKTKVEERNELLKETALLTHKLVKRMTHGEVEPQPSDPKLCNDCQWNKVCRYPQLNL